MPEVETEVFTNQEQAFFVKLADGLHRAENMMTIETAEKNGLITKLVYKNRTIIIASEDVTFDGKKQTVEVVESAHEGQVKGKEVTLKPPKNCDNCGVSLKPRTVISEDHIDHISCPNCSTRNDVTLIQKDKTFNAFVISDDRSFDEDFEGPADAVLEKLKSIGEKIGDMIGARDTELENVLKPFAHKKIRVWDFENDGDISPDSLVIQVGELKTSVLIAEDITPDLEESDSEDDEPPDEDRKPTVGGKLSVEFITEESDYDVIVVKGPDGQELPLYVLYDGQSPSQLVISSEALKKGGWKVKGTNDFEDGSESYNDLLTVVEDEGLLDDNDTWEVETEYPFGAISVEESKNDDDIPAWAERMDTAGYPPNANELYIIIDVPNYDLRNIKITHQASHAKKGKKK